MARCGPVLLALLSLLGAACLSHEQPPPARVRDGAPPASPAAMRKCDDTAATVRDRLQSAADAAGACESDDQCEAIPLVATCFQGCPRAIAKAGEAQVKAAIAQADEGACAAFVKAGCKVAVPACPADKPPRCVAGRCK